MYDLSVAGIKYIYWILIFVCMEPFLMIYVNKMYTFTHISLKDNSGFFRVHPRGTMNICTVAHSRDFPLDQVMATPEK